MPEMTSKVEYLNNCIKKKYLETKIPKDVQDLYDEKF